jgi:hypothetical protein
MSGEGVEDDVARVAGGRWRRRLPGPCLPGFGPRAFGCVLTFELVGAWQRIHEQQATIVAPRQEREPSPASIARDFEDIQQLDPGRLARGARPYFVVEP